MSENKEASSDSVVINTTFDVLKREYSQFWPKAKLPDDEADYFRKAYDNGQAALCLSGGGIRSAAFGLGVLQALSKQGVLDKFHYVSSVSGGGYINAWLQRWLYNMRAATLAAALADAAKALGDTTDAVPTPTYKTPASIVADRLKDDNEPYEIKQLRQNSNFITPRIGLASNDTWTALAMSLRNVLTNWLVFGPLLLLVALIPNLFYHGIAAFVSRANVQWLTQILLALAAIAAGCAAWNTIRAVPSYRAETASGRPRNDNWHVIWIVLPFAIWSVCGTLAVTGELLGNAAPSIPWLTNVLPGLPFPPGTALAAATLAGILAGFAMATISRTPEARAILLRDIPVALIALLVMVWLLLLGPWLFQALGLPAAGPRDILDWRAVMLALTAPLWLIATQLIATIIFVALRKPAEQTGARTDDDREWLARLSAIKLKLMLLWAVAASAALVLNRLLDSFASGYDMSLSTLLAALTGYVALAGGSSGRTASEASAADRGGSPLGAVAKVAKLFPAEALVAVATALFAILLLLLLARIEMRVAAPIADKLTPVILGLKWEGWLDANVAAHFALLAVFGVFLWFMLGRIDINRFSLNGLYRNRLARGFLGAARLDRKPDSFTGFDGEDNIRLHKLTEKPDEECACLYPVINVALNVTSTENLAWQERKAEPFIFSPLYCGSILLDENPSLGPQEPRGAFIDSALYGGREPDLAMEGTGVSLATAMSISGAAASPNMGYHSSAATAFLMTLFNVRLGAWMNNPAVINAKGAGVANSRSVHALSAILSELAGTTNDRGRDIYLSDGGHFENLGLYEMLRRGCRYILVSDAGCDPQCDFTDLGNAVRKAKIDLNVDISFEEMRVRRRAEGPDTDNAQGDQTAFAIGTITYPHRDGDTPRTKRREGKLIYLKSSYFAEDKLPPDVVAYAKLNKTFPHETTADQFFSESQFESYRKLGYRLGLTLGSEDGEYTSLRTFFATAARNLTPPKPRPARRRS